MVVAVVGCHSGSLTHDTPTEGKVSHFRTHFHRPRSCLTDRNIKNITSDNQATTLGPQRKNPPERQTGVPGYELLSDKMIIIKEGG